MADGLGADFFLIFVLILFQLVILGIFITLYVRKRQASFLSLIFSVFFFITSNILTLAFIQRPQSWPLDFFQALLGAAGLAPIVVFLEIFENGESFTQRSSLSIIFIIIVGAVKGASHLFSQRLGEFINLMAPIMFILVGAFYLSTIKKMRERIRFENQKSKIRKMRVGIYLTFIIPKFLIGALIALTVLPVMLSLIPNVTIFEGYDVSFLQRTDTIHIFDMLLNTIQTIGLVIMTIPIVYSRSVFFMQSRKVSRLIVINRDGVPVFEFPFEQEEDDVIDEEMLTEAYAAVSTIIGRGGLASQQLRTINFSDLELLTEIRDNFAVVLIVDRPTKFLIDSLENFADEFQDIFPANARLGEIRTQKLKYTAEKMVQKSFDLEDEEFEQIRIIVSEGYDKVADEYLKTRSEEDPEIKLLPDFMKRLPVGARVLDAGCGAGEPTTRLLSEKFKVTGVDISKKQIEIARENLPFCEFIWQDMTTLTFPDDYFDGLISFYAIPHIPREEHKGLLENLYRMLKSNGIALLCFGTSDDPGTVVDDFFGVKMYWSSFDAGTNIEMLKEVGFHVIWLKLILDDVTETQHIFIMAQKLDTEFLNVIDAMEDVEDKIEAKLIIEEEVSQD
ncbi:MAG: methyltransferase domain-containing protein [Candidatus Heimdallarchaeota archaeon]|nr:methyltransferase domain-containing protein [Candidatus Heimdallarchaeota archaeon]MBY8994814.1 methyltransferase domain-containing protein [Candidatus Heimdallarchaeota archaeon]